jgi:hypothetical protein
MEILMDYDKMADRNGLLKKILFMFSIQHFQGYREHQSTV